MDSYRDKDKRLPYEMYCIVQRKMLVAKHSVQETKE